MIERPDLAAVAPEPDPESAPFWAALAQDELLVPACRPHDHRFFPPMPACPRCGSADLTFTRASGCGIVYSWATIHIALDPAFTDDAPYTIVAVDLEGGGRMIGRLLDGDTEGLSAGATVDFAAYRAGGHALPGFQLRRAAGDATQTETPEESNA